ncbi:hypothetical protein [Pseudoalteromonas nigrifaciens]|uniref:hypothetical protein n=1 Tax=Pseudoalteromonas nigrifaciens TaxID=28109 RepID=UPI003FD10F35
MSDIENTESNKAELSDERKAELNKIADELASEDIKFSQNATTGNPDVDAILNEAKRNSEQEAVDLNVTEGVDVIDNDESNDQPNEGSDAVIGDSTHAEMGSQQTNDIPSFMTEQIPIDSYDTDDSSFEFAQQTDIQKEEEHNINEIDSTISEDGGKIQFEAVESHSIEPEDPFESSDDIIFDEENADIEFDAINEASITPDDESVNVGFEPAGQADSADNTANEVDEHLESEDDSFNFSIEEDIESEVHDNDFTQAETAEGNNELDDVEGNTPEGGAQQAAHASSLAAAIAAMQNNQHTNTPHTAGPMQQNAAPQQMMQEENQKGVNFSFGSLRSLFRKNEDVDPSEKTSSFSTFREQSTQQDVDRLSKLQTEHKTLMSQAVELTNPENYNPENKEKVLNILDDINKTSSVIEEQTERLSARTTGMPEIDNELASNQSNFKDSVNKLTGELEGNVEELNDDSMRKAMENIAKAIKEMFEKIFKRNNTSPDMEMR